MAVEIGALRALLSLDSAAFETGVKRAQASMNGLQRTLSKSGERMKAIGRRMSATVTAPMAAGVAALGASAMRSAVEIERMAALSNSTTREFQKFAAGARTVGIESDKLADIFKDVNDRVGDFMSTGGGPMADFFENIAPKVGVTADQFAKLSGPQALQLYVSSLEKAGVSQQEMTFYMEAMASDATALVPLLRNSGREMSKLGDEAEDLGAIMSQETLDALNKTRASFRELTNIGTGLRNELAAALAPVVERLSGLAADLARNFSEMSPEMKRFAAIAVTVAAGIGPLAIAMGFIATGLAALASPIGLVVLGLSALAGAAIYVAANWDGLKDRFPILEKAADIGAVLREKWTDLPSIKWAALIPVLRWGKYIPGLRWASFVPRLAWSAIVTPLVWTAKLLPKVPWATMAGALSWRALITPLVWGARFIPVIGWGVLAGQLAWSLLIKPLGWDDFIPKINWSKYIPKINWDTIGLGVSGEGARGGRSARRKARLIGKDISSGLAEGITENAGAAAGAAAGAVDQASQAARDAAEIRSPSRVFAEIGGYLMEGAAVGIADKAQAAADAAANAAAQVTEAFNVDADETGLFQKIEDGVSGITDAMAGAIVQGRDMGAALRQVFQQMAKDMLSAGLKGLFRSVLFQGAGGGILSSLFGGFRADGGPVSTGKAYIVGERGPELHVPKSAGTIIPNHKLGGGTTVHQPINIDARGAQAGVGEEIRRVLREEMPAWQRRTVEATYERAREVPIG